MCVIDFFVGPSQGLDNVHWDHQQLYGQEHCTQDDDVVSVFSGLL